MDKFIEDKLECLMFIIGSKYKPLSERITSSQKTPNNFIDMRGFDWSNNRVPRPRYLGSNLVRIDFSNSRAETGFLVKKGVFEECIFDKSMWWLAGLIKCKFIKCSFNNCRLYSSRLRGKFYDCSFKNLSGKGEYFSFGWGSEYKNCIFESVHLRNIGDVIGVTFEDCKISGLLENGVFRGWRYALNERFASIPDIFSRVYWPVKFIRCDLSNLKTNNIIFEKDVVLKKTNFG